VSGFAPLGDEARWRILYRLLVDVPTGEILTYKAMAQALDLDPVRDRPAMVIPLRRAAREHEEKDKRAVEVVRGEGYRVVDVDGHLRLAHKHGRRAGAQLEAAYSKVVNVDLSDVDPEVRRAFEVVARGFSDQMEINRRFSARQDRTERAVDLVTARSDRTEEEIAQLHERLASLEERLSPTVEHGATAIAATAAPHQDGTFDGKE
jgi:hypothetical protein